MRSSANAHATGTSRMMRNINNRIFIHYIFDIIINRKRRRDPLAGILLLLLFILFHPTGSRAWGGPEADTSSATPDPEDAPASRPSPAPAETSLTVVEDGVSPYAIVISSSAPTASARLAAGELQRYLEQVSGAMLPIVDRTEGPAIFIGPGDKVSGVDFAALAPEGYVMQTIGGDLLLAGNDTPGDPYQLYGEKATRTPTLFAVYHFLEEYAGIHWYWPGAGGESWTRHPTIRIPAHLKRLEAPVFQERHLSMGPFDRERREWLRRNRIGTSLGLVHHHNWFRILPEDEYLDAHPEYFALVNGVRGTRGGDPSHRHQVCTTEPGVVKHFVDYIEQFIREHPDRQHFSIAANDSGGFCECSRCLRLDGRSVPDPKAPITKRIFDFYNRVAAGVAENHPDFMVSAYAYGELREPPSTLEVHPNLIPIDVYNFASVLFHNPRWWHSFVRTSSLWRSAAPQSAFASWWIFPHAKAFSVPIVAPGIIHRVLDHLRTVGNKGVFFSIPGDNPSFGHDAWLMARLLWDPTGDADALLADYYEGLFGLSAGPRVRAYHQQIEQRLRHLARTMTSEHPIGYGPLVEALGPALEAGDYLLGRVDPSELSDEERARFEVIVAHNRYLRLTRAGFSAFAPIERRVLGEMRAPDATSLADARAALEARNGFLKKARGGFGFDPARLLEADKGSCTPFSMAMLDALESGRFPTLRAKAIASASPTEADWEDADVSTPLGHRCSGVPAEVATRFRALYSSERLFIRVTADEPDERVLHADRLTTRDAPVWLENDIEVFLDPRGDGHAYIQLATNTLGALFDASKARRPRKKWDGDVSVDVHVLRDRWIATFVIPFSTLDVRPPAPGDTWRLNVARQRFSSRIEVSAWSRTFGGLHRPYFFGTLVFGPRPAP